jgi:hypothetical protein
MVAVAGMAVLGTTATLAGAQTHPAPLALNDVMQAPFAWDLLAAPKAAAVAWVFSTKGCSRLPSIGHLGGSFHYGCDQGAAISTYRAVKSK